MLHLLLVQTNRVRWHNVLCAAEEVVPDNVAACVSSFGNAVGNMGAGQVPRRYVATPPLVPRPALSIILSGGNATFPNLLNNFVHVCMYFYYMMSAMGPEYAKFLWWKKYMTELQIVSAQIANLSLLIRFQQRFRISQMNNKLAEEKQTAKFK